MRKLFLRMHREEDGQVMLLALITAIFLVLVMAFPLNVGWTISKRLKLQNAADAAAYSAAVVQADGLSAIAWLNNAMSWCYQRQYGLELKFNTYGVYAILESWGDHNGAGKPQNDDYDLDGVAWYKDFKDKANNKAPIDAFKEFLNGEARLINQDRNGYAVEKRTLEMWTRMLRTVAEEIAKKLPDMMRFEAMRIAYLNTYDGVVKNNSENQVYMAFFPDNNSAPVQLNFEPNRNSSQYAGEVATDNSFMQYERWYDKKGGGCRFVERAMQIAADLNAFFMDSSSGKLNTPEVGDHHIVDNAGKLNMGSIDVKDKAWYNEYDGEPLKSNGLYLSFAKTVVCWHSKDKEGKGGHEKPDKTPCGHWHPKHTHLHFNCTHITIPPTLFTPPFHFHIPIPTVHENGFEKNQWCLLERIKCPQWSSPLPGCGCVGVGSVQEALTQGIDAAQKVVNQCTAVVQQAEQVVQQAQDAYDAAPDALHFQALEEAKAQLDEAKRKLEEARANVQALLDTVAKIAGAMGLNPIMETHVNLSVIPISDIDLPVVDSASPGKGSDIEAWWHHAVHYCELCFQKDGAHNREFPKSDAKDFHGLAYHKNNVFVPDQSQRADHHFSLPDASDSKVDKVKDKKKSMVRAYISDLLSSAYCGWLDFKREAAFHQIHKSNYSPEIPQPAPGKIDTKLCPTIIFKPVSSASDKQNFFNWGITVALWQKHHSIMFRRYTAAEGSGGVFSEMEGMLALASAKVGIRVQPNLYGDKSGRKGASRYFPNRLVCGIGEKSRAGEPGGPYDASYMREQFLSNRDRSKPILNLFHTDWGARLIPIQKSVPEGLSAMAAKYVLTQTKQVYYYAGANAPPGVLNDSIGSATYTGVAGQGWTDDEWKFLTKLLVH